MTANEWFPYDFNHSSSGDNRVTAVKRFLSTAARAGRTVTLALLLTAWSVAAARALEPGPAAFRDSLYALTFLDSGAGWAVGAFGAILHTADGGQTWRPQASGTTEPLFGVAFADGQHGCAVGRSGLILATADGGETWTARGSGTDRHLFQVAFGDAQTGCAVGDWGTIVTTRDGGTTWQHHPLPRDVMLNDVTMLDAGHGWIVGEAGTVLETEDGGDTWIERDSGVTKTLFGVHFTDPQHGWAVGIDALILRTVDAGLTWQIQHGSAEVGELEQVAFDAASQLPSLYAVRVVGASGVVVGENGAIFTSTDGGDTWGRLAVPHDWGLVWLRDVSMNAARRGGIVGADGRRIAIEDGRVALPAEPGNAAQAAH